MKKIWTIAALAVAGLLMSFAPTDSELGWKDWNEGYKAARKEKKILLIDVYTNWCGWCKKMDRDTYADQGVKSVIEKDFVPVKFNPERTDITYTFRDTITLNGQQLLNALTSGKRSGYPTTIFLDASNNNILLAQAGYMGAGEFKDLLKKIKEQQKEGRN